MKPLDIYGVKKDLTYTLIFAGASFILPILFSIFAGLGFSVYFVPAILSFILFPLLDLYLLYGAFFKYDKYKKLKGTTQKINISRVVKPSIKPGCIFVKLDGDDIDHEVIGNLDSKFILSSRSGDPIQVFVSEQKQVIMLEKQN